MFDSEKPPETQAPTRSQKKTDDAERKIEGRQRERNFSLPPLNGRIDASTWAAIKEAVAADDSETFEKLIDQIVVQRVRDGIAARAKRRRENESDSKAVWPGLTSTR